MSYRKEKSSDLGAIEDLRMAHEIHIHFEEKIYSTTNPLLAIAITLGGVSYGVGEFSFGVMIFSSLFGSFISLISLITVVRMNAYVTQMKKELKRTGDIINSTLWRREPWSLDGWIFKFFIISNVRLRIILILSVMLFFLTRVVWLLFQ